MEIQMAVDSHLSNTLMSPLTTSTLDTTPLEDSSLQSKDVLLQLNDNSLNEFNRSHNTDNVQSNLEIEQSLLDLHVNNNTTLNATSKIHELNSDLKQINGSLSNIVMDEGGCGDNATIQPTTEEKVLTNSSLCVNMTTDQQCIIPNIKKRISSSRTPTRKARRIKFYRNGDRFYPGIIIPVSNERYRSFESLFEDLTRLLEENVNIPGAVRTIYTMNGKKISSLDDLEDGVSYVCSCNNENFKKIEYNVSSQHLSNLVLSNKNNRLTKQFRPSSPLKNGFIIASFPNGTNIGNISFSGGNSAASGMPIVTKVNERDSVVYPRIVTLIRNGTKPRKIMRLLLNKRNSPSFDHVLTCITQKVHLDTGYVRKIFTLSGNSVTNLADFFGSDDVFFAYGTERVNNPEDFKLEADEQKVLQSIRKNIRSTGTTCETKPKMPVKSKKIYDEEESSLLDNTGIDANDLPLAIRERYILGQTIGDGNFAVVLKVRDRQTSLSYALKIIDKSKCKGKEHYIDAEVRVMKKLSHPHIISLIMDADQQSSMYLVLEYISGGDLFDAITRVTRFSEDQSRIMIRHLASAMSYLHSMSIVHRDIKPENLLVELDEKGNVLQLKLADFGLACEVSHPLYAVCGTPTYVAPEILLETGYGLKIDVWAAGIILYILLCGFPPFVSTDNQQEPLFDAIISGSYEFPEPYWIDIGDDVRDLINNMLQSDPDVRFTSEDILDHYWTMDDRS